MDVECNFKKIFCWMSFQPQDMIKGVCVIGLETTFSREILIYQG